MTRPVVPHTAAAQVFAEGGAFGELLAGVDWAATPLGPAETWPAPLVATLRLMLASELGMLLKWGAEATVLYNASHVPRMGAKHPWALGRPGNEVFPEIWDHPACTHIRYVTDTRKPLLIRDEPTIWDHHGFFEQCYLDVAGQPVFLEDDTVGGGLFIMTDTTGRVLGERRLRLLSEIGARTAGLPTPGEVAQVVAKVTGGYPEDIPFLFLYLVSEPGVLQLAAATGVSAKPGQVPQAVQLRTAGGTNVPARLAGVVAEGATVTLPTAAFADGSSAGEDVGGRRLPVEQALALPLHCTGQAKGVLVVGVNPCFPPAGDYRAFLEVLASAVAGALSGALAQDEQRRRAEALAELDRAKTTFFSNVSHEFRTPLTLLLGPLQQALAEEDRPRRRDQLQLAERGALRLLKLVNTLLDATRAEAGRMRAVFEPVDLARATAELAGIFRSAFEAAGLTLEVSCPSLPQPVYVEREMWEKIVLNLLSNALKFTFTGGIKVAVAAVGDRARLTVTDTGTGIPADELPHLFTRFHQVRGARARSQEGSGIGLALVKDLVELHGGTIRLDSRLGQGTTATVEIPFGTAHLPRQDRPAPRGELPGEAQTDQSSGVGHARAAYVNEALGWLTTTLAGDQPGPTSLPPPRPGPTAAPAYTPHDAPAPHGDGAPNTSYAPHAPQQAAPHGPHGPARHPDSHSPRPQEAGRPCRARVLVVDDNADMRAYLSQLLQPEYEVLLATDGQDGWETAVAQPVDLVLTDVMMPRLDGFGLVRALRADQRTARLPIVMLTARADEEASVEGLHAGAEDYLAKPFSARQLLARVRTGVELDALREEVLAQARSEIALLTSLNDAGLRLTAPLDPDQVLHTVGELLLPDLADQVGIYPAEPGPAEPRSPAYTAGVPLLAPAAAEAAAEAALHGSLPDHSADTVLALPLRARDSVLGALVVTRRASYSPVEGKYLENLANWLALAYDTASRYHTERRLALTLQQALLPHQLPAIPQLRLASHYQASTRGTEVGGDWYDVLTTLPGGGVGLAIGDVMGHDADAATVMGRLRSVLHGLALEGAGPAEALTKLDAYLQTLDADRFATCLYAIYHPDTRRLRYAASGHLPPLLVKGEHTGYLEVPPALPLGLGSSPTDCEVTIPPGTGLLLYTDGLVEHHRQPLEAGLTTLCKTCATLPTPTHPQQLIKQALTLLSTSEQADDDTALLAVGTSPRKVDT
jgi:signal transduction histidine kinase/CheY-like chemotaxis protein